MNCAHEDGLAAKPMQLPAFNVEGDLPVGLHRATLDEVLDRFGISTPQRLRVYQRLLRIHRVAETTGCLDRFVVFGSFVTSKPDPNDVDILLVMRDDFQLSACSGETRKLFYHDEAEAEFGASIFWIRPSMLVLDTIEDFVLHWQIKRDLGRRGIVEVIE
jgi:predicted nucleotidyltransferase